MYHSPENIIREATETATAFLEATRGTPVPREEKEAIHQRMTERYASLFLTPPLSPSCRDGKNIFDHHGPDVGPV